MRLDFIEVCGFRGFRDLVRINFGRGFTVITGRNGVGKSTLCDAVEFAITGSIDKYAVEKAAKESLSDYLWWRGEGVPKAHYVTASFVDDSGKPFTITRTRERGSDRSPEEIQVALCQGPAPDDALRQLTRTSIIRDEWIAALSLDLTETERFDLVRSALGALEGSEAGSRAKEVVTAAEAAHTKDEAAYEAARSRLADRLTQQSETQAALSRSGDVSGALQLIAAAAPDAPTELTARLAAGRNALATDEPDWLGWAKRFNSVERSRPRRPSTTLRRLSLSARQRQQRMKRRSVNTRPHSKSSRKPNNASRGKKRWTRWRRR
ncbi:ATP-binding protein [Mesorhizobium australicum]|uniref:ATP-binding protein n=1 Tax=Mesorhizobium australicum TaxID=536018 RepID=UPI00333C4535